MFLGAFWATGLPWYGRLLAVSAQALLFDLAAFLDGACPTTFLPLLYGKADSLWFLGYFRLCGSGRGF